MSRRDRRRSTWRIRSSEPLTGRKLTFTLYPASYGELAATLGAFEAHAELERWLIWGGYPGIVTAESGLRERLLGELVGSYLYRDILELDGVRRADKIVDLLRLLAFQIGQEVSIAELATTLALEPPDGGAVSRPAGKGLRHLQDGRAGAEPAQRESPRPRATTSIDNGVRNSLIQNFNRLACATTSDSSGRTT